MLCWIRLRTPRLTDGLVRLEERRFVINIKKALEIVLGHVRPLTSHRTALGEALGSYLAEDIRADRDSPPTDRSAMDGFAVRASDLAKVPRDLRLIGEVAAGSAKRPRITPGACVRILTGASVPPGADAVVKVEDTVEHDGTVTFLVAAKRGANIRIRGEEVAKAQLVLSKGTVLTAPRIGLCASVGKATVKVYGRPGVAVLCTGRELRAPAAAVRPHELRDSNGPALLAALGGAGINRTSYRIVQDDPKTLAARLKTATAGYDVVIVTGGVSVGKYDFVPQAVAKIGAKVRFHGIAMKPGKPQLYATLSRNRHIFGLPGNPLSVLTGFGELVAPAIRRMSGLDAKACHATLRLPVSRAVKSKTTRAAFVLGKLISSSNGLRIRPLTSHGSADLVAGAQADGVFAVPQGVGKISAGELVDFTLWRSIP